MKYFLVSENKTRNWCYIIPAFYHFFYIETSLIKRLKNSISQQVDSVQLHLSAKHKFKIIYCMQVIDEGVCVISTW